MPDGGAELSRRRHARPGDDQFVVGARWRHLQAVKLSVWVSHRAEAHGHVQCSAAEM